MLASYSHKLVPGVPASPDLLGGDAIHGLLGGGVGVDGGHQTLLDSDALLVKSSGTGDDLSISQHKR